jgi:hypothetical protein
LEVTLAQKPDTAGQPDMPESAIASGCIDFVLSPEDIAKEIVRIAHEDEDIHVSITVMLKSLILNILLNLSLVSSAYSFDAADRSVPQIVVFVILTMASVGIPIAGAGLVL